MVEIKNPTSETTITSSATRKLADTIEEVKEHALNVTIDNPLINQTIEGFETLSKGEIPSNEQLLSGVEQMKDIVDKSSHYITSSQHIQERTINLLDIVKQLIEEKNKDQVLQQFIHNTNKFIERYADRVVEIVKETSDDVQEQESKSFYESVKNFSNFLFQLFRSNSFRYLMIDTLNYLRVFSTKNLTNIQVQANEGLKQAIQRLVNQFDDEELKKQVKDEMEVTEEEQKTGNAWDTPFLESASKKKKKKHAKQQKTSKIVQSVEPSKSDVKDVEIKQDELKDQIYTRFSELINEFSSNRSYRKAVLGFFNLFDQLKHILSDDIESEVNHLVKEMKNDEYYKGMKENGEKLLIQWVGDEKVIKDMEHSLKDIYKTFSHDRVLSKLLTQLQNDTRRYLKNPSLLEKEMDHIKSDLYTIRERIEKKDMKAFDRFNGQLHRAIQIMKSDQIVNNLNRESKKLIQDLFFDEKGGFHIRSGTLDELKVMMVSMIKETVSSLSQLDIHYVDENVEYELKGLKLNAADFLPSHVKMSGRSVTDIDYSEDKLAESLNGTQSTLVLHLSGMVFHFKDVQFWFNRFSFPQMSDEGLLDIDSGDDGVMIHLKVEIDTTSNEDNTEWFKYNSITVDIDDLKLKFTHAEHHEILLRVLSGYIQNNFRRRIKDQLQDMLQTYFIDGLQRLNNLLEHSSENISKLGDQWAESSLGLKEMITTAGDSGEGITESVSRFISNQFAGMEEL